jgi:sarcosine oxidase, subunit gamma
MTFIQTSPISHAQHHAHPVMGSLNGMEIAIEFDTPQLQQAHAALAGVAEFSAFARFAVKGAGAAEWLSAQGITLPSAANTWLMQDSTLVLRLGNSEYLLEDQFVAGHASRLAQGSAPVGAKLYPVARSDAALVLSGEHALSILAEACALDIAAELAESQRLLMTQVAGISVTLLKQTLNGGTVYRLWCDGTYGGYLWHELTAMAHEFGGGPVGLSFYFK